MENFLVEEAKSSAGLDVDRERIGAGSDQPLGPGRDRRRPGGSSYKKNEKKKKKLDCKEKKLLKISTRRRTRGEEQEQEGAEAKAPRAERGPGEHVRQGAHEGASRLRVKTHEVKY